MGERVADGCCRLALAWTGERSVFSIQCLRLSSSGRARAWRTEQRSSAGLPRISSSIPYSAPMRSIASVVVGEA